MPFTTNNPMIRNTRQAQGNRRYEITTIKCPSKEVLRKSVGNGVPFPFDTEGEIRCVTNDANTFYAAIRTHIEERVLEYFCEEDNCPKKEVYEVAILDYVC